MSQCKHPLAPLQGDQEFCDKMQIRNWRKCAACGMPLWDDGSVIAYIGTGEGEALPEPASGEGSKE